jgi:hypothetical protein
VAWRPVAVPLWPRGRDRGRAGWVGLLGPGHRRRVSVELELELEIEIEHTHTHIWHTYIR